MNECFNYFIHLKEFYFKSSHALKFSFPCTECTYVFEFTLIQTHNIYIYILPTRIFITFVYIYIYYFIIFLQKFEIFKNFRHVDEVVYNFCVFINTF